MIPQASGAGIGPVPCASRLQAPSAAVMWVSAVLAWSALPVYLQDLVRNAVWAREHGQPWLRLMRFPGCVLRLPPPGNRRPRISRTDDLLRLRELVEREQPSLPNIWPWLTGAKTGTKEGPVQPTTHPRTGVTMAAPHKFAFAHITIASAIGADRDAEVVRVVGEAPKGDMMPGPNAVQVDGMTSGRVDHWIRGMGLKIALTSRIDWYRTTRQKYHCLIPLDPRH